MHLFYPRYHAQSFYRNTFLVDKPQQIARAEKSDREWNNLAESGCHFTCLAMIAGVDPALLADLLGQGEQLALADLLDAEAVALLDPARASLVAEVETLLSRAATPDWGRVLKLAETLAGRDAEARFEAAQDAVLRFVSAEIDRRRDEPPARLAALVEVADRFGRAAREAAIYNLDRRPVVLSLFGDLAEVA